MSWFPSTLSEELHGRLSLLRAGWLFDDRNDSKLFFDLAPNLAARRKTSPIAASSGEGLHDEVATRRHQGRDVTELAHIGVFDGNDQLCLALGNGHALVQIASHRQPRSLTSRSDRRQRGQVIVKRNDQVATFLQKAKVTTEAAPDVDRDRPASDIEIGDASFEVRALLGRTREWCSLQGSPPFLPHASAKLKGTTR